MFDNLLHQDVRNLLENDIAEKKLPGAVLFAGPEASGKLTCALETARVLSCTAPVQGEWMCTCPSCRMHKSLVSQNLLLAGPRDCTLEISAAASVFLNACMRNSTYLNAARYLYLRSVRKLTMRFNPVLWADDDKLSKIATVTGPIDEIMETLDFPHDLPEEDDIKKAIAELGKLCGKLESDFLYDSIPVRQIRNISMWARMKSTDGRKTVIIENADRMLESVRNALLKILEEPPEDCLFILLTSNRSAVMPTILSRVRTYQFTARKQEDMTDVVSRVFHSPFTGSINGYLQTFLPVKPDDLNMTARDFFEKIAGGGIPEAPGIVSSCSGFEPRVLFRLFLQGITEAQKKLLNTPAGAECSVQCMQALRECWNAVTIYNQTPVAALESLTRELAKINKMNGNIFRSIL